MDFGELIPIVAILSSAWVIVTALHYRNAKKRDPVQAGMTTAETRENVQLARENEGLKLTIDRLEDRLAVLERIATDPAERTAREIERLR